MLAAARRGETLTPDDFAAEAETERVHAELVNRLLKYVDAHVAHAVRALSAARSFDWAVYAELGRALHFRATEPDFEVLTGFSFVWPVEGVEVERYRVHTLLRDDPTTRRADAALEAYYRDREGDAGVAEAIYHVGRQDPERGIREWLETFEEALQGARYDLCAALREVCGRRWRCRRRPISGWDVCRRRKPSRAATGRCAWCS